MPMSAFMWTLWQSFIVKDISPIHRTHHRTQAFEQLAPFFFVFLGSRSLFIDI